MKADYTSRCLHQKVALITGGVRRIGAEIARCLHASGMNLVLHYNRSEADASRLADELNASRTNSVVLVQADLCSVEALSHMAIQAKAAFGQLDVLINNASTFYATPVGSITQKHWDDLMGTNLKAPLFLSQALADELGKNQGTIINIVDIHALKPLQAYPVYSVAKAGLWALTQSLARELGPDVRVNGVAPGAILWPESIENVASHTEMINKTLLKREGSPTDIARTVRFLLSDADYITGQVIAVDGGRSV